MGFFRKLLFCAILYIAISSLLGWKTLYSLKVRHVKSIAYDNSGILYSAKNIRKAFLDEYPDKILHEKNFPPLPTNTGGLRGTISLLYVSVNEFLGIYHAELETFGSTGRHFLNVSIHVLQGRLTESKNYMTPAIHYSPGESTVLRMGEISNLKLDKGTTLLLYSRGYLPLSTGYLISESLFMQHDILLVIITIVTFIQAYLWQYSFLWVSLTGNLNYIWKNGYQMLLNLPVQIQTTFKQLWNKISNFFI